MQTEDVVPHPYSCNTSDLHQSQSESSDGYFSDSVNFYVNLSTVSSHGIDQYTAHSLPELSSTNFGEPSIYDDLGNPADLAQDGADAKKKENTIDNSL